MKSLVSGAVRVSCVSLICAGYLALGQTPEQFPQIDEIINDAVRTNLIPGAVLIVGHNGEIVYRKAYGSRSLIPARYHLRCRVTHQSGGDYAFGDEAFRGRQDPHRRSGDEVSA